MNGKWMVENSMDGWVDGLKEWIEWTWKLNGHGYMKYRDRWKRNEWNEQMEMMSHIILTG